MVLPLRNGGLIIKFDNEHLAKWLRDTEGKMLLTEYLGPSTSIHGQTYPIVAQYLPINLPVEDETLLCKIEKENNLPNKSIASMRWIKPPQC
jgi:hypothetical protein